MGKQFRRRGDDRFRIPQRLNRNFLRRLGFSFFLFFLGKERSERAAENPDKNYQLFFFHSNVLIRSVLFAMRQRPRLGFILPVEMRLQAQSYYLEDSYTG